MKHFFLPILGVALAFTTACTSSNKSEANESETEATEATDETTAADDPVIVLGAKQAISPSDKPVVIDFNATWCGPCQAFKPNFHSVASKYADRAVFYSVDIDENPELAAQYNVSAIPTIVIIKPDGTFSSSTGYMEEPEFEGLVQKAVE